MLTGRTLRHVLLLLLFCLPGCGHVVTHDRLVPVQHADAADGVRIPCARGHIRMRPIYVNSYRGRQPQNPKFFTFAVEYADIPMSCSTGDLALVAAGGDAVLAIEDVVKSRRYPDRPGVLTCFYRMRNSLQENALYRLKLHPSLTGCTAQNIHYRYESRREHRWPVEK